LKILFQNPESGKLQRNIINLQDPKINKRFRVLMFAWLLIRPSRREN